MKSFMCVLVLCASTAFAQSSNRVSLQLGSVTVWLGMDKAAVKQTMEATGMVFPDKPGPDGTVLAVDVQAKKIYTLKFENRKLVYADRNWHRDDSDNLPTVMAALASLIDQGATKCTIEHAPISSPEMNMNRVFINCGERGILLAYGSVDGTSDNSVSERIGQYR